MATKKPSMRYLYRLDAAKKEKNLFITLVYKLLLLSLWQASKEVAYATAWRLAGESERTPLLSFYKVAMMSVTPQRYEF